MTRHFRASDPTANTAIANVTRQNKVRAPRERTRRRIVEEFPQVFTGLTEAEKVTVTLAAAKLAGTRDAWAITAEHLEAAKVEYLRGRR